MKYFVLLLAVCALAPLSWASCVTDASNPGCVHFAWKTSSATDAYTSAPTATQQAWFKSHMYRIMWYSGYGDSRVSWFPNSWVYRDSSAIYNGDATAVNHSSWIMYDRSCLPLFINWGCANGSCPQYSPNYGNIGFRSWWIQSAQSQLVPGYIGLFIDDVSLPMDLTNGTGSDTPIDPNTDQPMTQAAWEQYIADFVTDIRQQFPKTEIVHNAVWYAGNADPSKDPYVTQQIKAADYINLERGFADTGLTGDGGFWSIQNLFAFIDQVHALGTRFIAQQYDFDGSFSLAAYFLVNSGNDLFSVDAVTPDNWPALYDVDLGAPQGSRYTWDAVLRRDFANGIVLLNPPGAATVNVALPGTYADAASGATVTSVSLPGRSGAILIAQAAPPPPPPPSTTPPSGSGQPIPNGVHTIQNAYSRLVLDDPNWSKAAGMQMIQWAANGGANQQWIFVYQASTGAYTIQNAYSHLYLADIAGRVQQVKNSGYPSQQWIAMAQNGNYVFKNKATGKVLDDPNWSTSQGERMITWGANGGLNQAWTVK